MKKLIYTVAIIIGCTIGITGCNMQIIDLNWKYDTAITRWPDGTMKTIEIKSWKDYEGEQIQVIGRDGSVYLLSSFNTVLMKK